MYTKKKYIKYVIKADLRRWIIVNQFGLLSVLTMLVIFLFSSQQGSDSAMVSNSFANLFSLIGLKSIVRLFNIRKLAHFTLYAVLGTCIFTHMRYKYMFEHKIHYFISTFLYTFVYACTDEIHQLFVPGRGGHFTDVLIDSAGCIFALVVNFIIIELLIKRDNNKADLQSFE